MEPLNTTELQQLMNIMHEMMQAVSDANWPALTRLDSERRALLKYDPAFDVSVSDRQTTDTSNASQAVHNVQEDTMGDSVQIGTHSSDGKSRKELIQKIRMLDEKIIHTMLAARQKLLAENRELSAQVNAKSCYAKTGLMT